MITIRAVCTVFIYGFALAVVTPTARAETPSMLNFAISAGIDSHSAAARAARRWINDLPANTRPQITTLQESPSAAVAPTGIVLVSLTQWSRKQPEFNILRLPFFYAGLSEVHHAIDGQTGIQLAQASATAGWKLLAIWDDGMSDLSGSQDYSHLLNLKGMEFAVWDPDPIQAVELRALDVWMRVIKKNGVQRNAQQCIVDSRSTTPATMWREHLHRVHLDITLTGDRFEGYVLAMPLPSWHKLSTAQRRSMLNSLRQVTAWERSQAAQQQQRALEALRKAGMQLHPLSSRQRHIFASRMPAWKNFFGALNTNRVDSLIAATGTAAATGTGFRAGINPPANSLPTANATE